MIFSAIGAGNILLNKKVEHMPHQDIQYNEKTTDDIPEFQVLGDKGLIELINEGFEAGSTPAGWTNTGWLWDYQSAPCEGIHWDYSWAAGDTLTTPALDFQVNTELTFQNAVETATHPMNLEIYVDGIDLVWSDYRYTHTDCELNTVDLSIYSGDHTISFVGMTSDFYGQILDDIVVTTVPSGSPGDTSIQVEKLVWNGTAWNDSAIVFENDTVQFNVSIYNPYCEYTIQFSGLVKDELPCNLRYVNGSSTIYQISGGDDWPNLEEVFWDTNTVLWIKPPDIPPLQYLNFTYSAIAVCDCGSEYESNYLLSSPDVLVNIYNSSDFIINDGSLNVSDNANVKVICEEPHYVDVTKYVKKDGCTYDYEKYISFDYGDFSYVTFKLYVNLTGSFDEVVVKDCLPSHLSYKPGYAEVDGVSDEPTLCGSNCYCWEFNSVPDDKHYVITFRANVDDCGDAPNHVNVSAKYDCCNWLYDDDEATVDVVCQSSIVVDKKTSLDGIVWFDEITAYVGDDIEFKLVVTNTGEMNLTSVTVADDLPSFLIYNDDANITPSVSSDHHIEWNLGTLIFGSSKEIIFSAHAASPGTGDNIAGVTTCQGVSDQDDVHVIVAGMIVEKEVWDPCISAWMEEIDASVGETVRFMITIYYYGNGTYDLYNIRVRDELPECLDYDNNADPTETDVSSDGKTIWWNLSTHVSAGDSTEIEFDALITETSGCGPCINWVNVTASECSGETFYWEDSATVNAECPVVADAGGPYFGEIDEYIHIGGSAMGGTSPYVFRWDLDDDDYYDDATGQSVSRSWDEEGTYVISLKVTDDDGRWDTDDTTVTISSPDNNPPDEPLRPSGTTSGDTGVSYTYTTHTTDPDDNNVMYGWDWNGDGSVDEWTGLYDSGQTVSTSHSWSVANTYNVKVKAKDEYGAKSGWSSVLTVTVSAANSPPSKPSMPSGPTSGKAGKSYTYSSSTYDSDADKVYFMFDWGDGSNSGWIGPYNSGQIVSASHIWNTKGSYSIKVKAKDDPNGDGDLSDGTESVWSDPLSISMPKNKLYINTLFLRIFENHPYLFPLLRFLLRL